MTSLPPTPASTTTPKPALRPIRVDKHSPTEMLFVWNNDEQFSVPFFEMRFFCPCASCVDEHTGQRTIQRSQVKPDIRAVKVDTVGRYALQIIWSDGHSTGIYHFDRLYELCQKTGNNLG